MSKDKENKTPTGKSCISKVKGSENWFEVRQHIDSTLYFDLREVVAVAFNMTGNLDEDWIKREMVIELKSGQNVKAVIYGGSADLENSFVQLGLDSANKTEEHIKELLASIDN